MDILFYFLLYFYAAAMGSSSIVLWRKKELPRWLVLVNLLSVLIFSLTPFRTFYFYLGLSSIFLCAIANGVTLNGLPNWKHVVIRLLFSLVIFYLFFENR